MFLTISGVSFVSYFFIDQKVKFEAVMFSFQRSLPLFGDLTSVTDLEDTVNTLFISASRFRF
jgi:hypothetical protein